MNTLAFYYLEFKDGSFCDIQTYESLCINTLNRGMLADVVTSHSPWRTKRRFIDKKVVSLYQLPDDYCDQFISTTI